MYFLAGSAAGGVSMFGLVGDGGQGTKRGGSIGGGWLNHMGPHETCFV